MIDFNSDRPIMFWTYAGRGEWHEDPLLRPIIREDRIAFDAPNQHSTRDDYALELRRQPDGTYDAGTKKFRYWCVRADTDDSVILTGNWKARPSNLPESGLFITVLPKPTDTGYLSGRKKAGDC